MSLRLYIKYVLAGLQALGPSACFDPCLMTQHLKSTDSIHGFVLCLADAVCNVVNRLVTCDLGTMSYNPADPTQTYTISYQFTAKTTTTTVTAINKAKVTCSNENLEQTGPADACKGIEASTTIKVWPLASSSNLVYAVDACHFINKKPVRRKRHASSICASDGITCNPWNRLQ